MENFDVVQRTFSWSVSESIPKFQARYLQESEMMLIEMSGDGLSIRLEQRKNNPDTNVWVKVDGRQVVNNKGNISECLQELSDNLFKWKDLQERVKINL
jgi:hypothetical protein